MNVPLPRWPRRPGHGDKPVCAVCREPIADLPLLRVHGAVLHRDCIGYRARQQLRGR